MRSFGDDEEFKELFPHMDEEDMMDSYIEASDAIQVAQIELARYELKQRLLFRCIDMVNDGFTKWCSHNSKKQKIMDAYKMFAALVEDKPSDFNDFDIEMDFEEPVIESAAEETKESEDKEQ